MPAASPSPISKPSKGCWTCKARKIQCDRSVPTCRRCSIAQRECEGYGVRLSWPRDNDRKRALRVALPATTTRTQTQCRNSDLMINTTSRDIELYQYLSLPNTSKPQNPALPSPKLWAKPRSNMTHMELLYYFREAAHYSLVTFNPATSHVRDAIMQMVFTHDTVSRRALFYALLAFSSLHRSGLHRETMALKVTALAALSASAKEAAQGSVEAAQHVAACMLLCAFEVSQGHCAWGTFRLIFHLQILLPSENSGEWLLYIRGATEVVQRAQLENQSEFTGSEDLLDWVYFHKLMSRFTLYHWRHNYLAVAGTDLTSGPAQHINRYSPLPEEPIAPLFQNRPHAILNVLSEICEVLLDPSDPRSQDIAYKDRLRALEWKVDNFPSLPAIDSDLGDSRDDAEFTAQLYRISTRVYLARASQDPGEPLANLDSLVEPAFAGPVQSCYCHHFFPLLIIAGEARTDEQRAAILNLIDRTEKNGYGRSMKAFRTQVQSFWIQHDLHEDGERILNYLGLMKAVVSSHHALPSYV
ncbi:fungal-specific transcription factor domain-containing protein [Xylaria sp. FL0933]|nr:fungal-specific transcription factor domain-containing protein [Xylaria sp. FL0933]